MKVLVVGGTGLVGSHVLRELGRLPNLEVTSLVRKNRSQSFAFPHIHERVFHFDDALDYEQLSHEKFDVVFCCLGTTRKKAGSAENFRRVDLEYPLRLLAALAKQDVVFCAVSSMGANKPSGLYLRTKFEMEKAITASGLRYVIVRPSLLLGERQEFRALEKLTATVVKPFAHILQKNLGKNMARFAPIEAEQVAKALVWHGIKNPPQTGGRVLEGRSFFTTG